MQKEILKKLMDEANQCPILIYSTDLLTFKCNIESTIRKVKKKLGALHTLQGEIDYEITIKHLDDE